MTPTHTITVDIHLTDDEWESTLVAESAAGLTASPKHLSPVWFYDELGSQLFDRITRLDEYYPTRAERALLRRHAVDIVAAAGPDTLIELGSGTSDKTPCLLDPIAERSDRCRYVPFDVSEETVRAAAAELVERYPGLTVHAVIGDFHRHLDTLPTEGRCLIAFLGGTIGNLRPAERGRFLRALRDTVNDDDHILIGFDLVKDVDVLVRAYDDADGVTAAFNRNALVHLNRRLDADFDPEAFEHVARWDAGEQWIEMHLRSRRDQRVRVDSLGLDLRFERGELLRTEISAKFTDERIGTELRAAGFEPVQTWVEPPGFALTLAHPT